MFEQARFDFAELDPKAANLHLEVGAADAVEHAVGPPSAEVARAVHPRVAADERIAHEALGRKRRTVQVALRDTRAADVDLARHADGHRRAVRVEHVDRRIADRPPDRRGLRGERARLGFPDRGERGGLGRAVRVQQMARRARFQHLPVDRRIGALAARDHAAQPREHRRIERHAPVEQRRREEQTGDADRRQLAGERAEIEQIVALHDADARAVEKRRPHFERRRVERRVRCEREPVRRVERRITAVHRQPRDAAMRDEHALRLPARARRVHHVCRCVAAALRRASGRVRRPRPGEQRRQIALRHAGRRRPVERRVAEHEPRAAVLRDERLARGRIADIDGHVGGAELEHRELRRDEPDRRLEMQRDAIARAHAGVRERVCDAVRARIERAIVERRRPVDDRGRIGRARRLRLEQPMHAAVRRIRPRGRVPALDQIAPFVARQHRQCIDALRVVRDHPFQQTPQVAGEALDRRALEQRARVFETAVDRIAALAQRQRQIELRDRARRVVERLRAQPFEPHLAARRVLPREHRLKHRAMRETARRLHPLDHMLERNVLMLLRGERARLHAREQLGHGRRAVEVHAQRDRVDEKADQALDLRMAAVRARRADHHVGLPRQARQQHAPRGEHGHEERRAVTPRERAQARRQRRVEREPDRRARIVGLRRTRPVRRQFEQRRRARERIAPVFGLRVQRRAADAALLPRRVIGVLHRQRRQRVGPPAGECAIQLAQLAAEHVDRPAVRHDVMDRHA